MVCHLHRPPSPVVSGDVMCGRGVNRRYQQVVEPDLA
jgi:hypothetical protein